MVENRDELLKKELSEIKKMLIQIQKDVIGIKGDERRELNNLKSIREMGTQELKNLSDIVGLENKELNYIEGISPKKYTTVIDWKSSVWEHCQDKVTNESKTLILFVCQKTKSPCSFESCPKNKIPHSNDNDD